MNTKELLRQHCREAFAAWYWYVPSCNLDDVQTNISDKELVRQIANAAIADLTGDPSEEIVIDPQEVDP